MYDKDNFIITINDKKNIFVFDFKVTEMRKGKNQREICKGILKILKKKD